MSRDLVRACAIGRAATLRRGPGPAGVRADGLFSPAGWDTPTWAQATCGGRVPPCRASACGGRRAATSVSRPASAHGLRKSGKNMPYKSGFGPFAPEVYRVPLSYPFRDGGITGEQAAARAVELIEKQVGAENVAAVVIEPIQGEGGFIVPAPGFLPALAAWTREAGAVFVADEVQTGFGRTGAMFACEHEGVVPDLIATAKGIAGGLPLSAVTGRAEIMDAPHVGGLGGTYGGNPVACAAALATIETLEADGLVARAAALGETMTTRLRAVQERQPAIGDVRGRGAMLAVELVRPGTSDPDPLAAAAVARACQEQGVVVLTCGTYGNVLRLLPPFVIGEERLADALEVLTGALLSVGAA